MGGGRSFHRPGTVNENVLESDFEPLCDGTPRHRSLADLRLSDRESMCSDCDANRVQDIIIWVINAYRKFSVLWF